MAEQFPVVRGLMTCQRGCGALLAFTARDEANFEQCDGKSWRSCPVCRESTWFFPFALPAVVEIASALAGARAALEAERARAHLYEREIGTWRWLHWGHPAASWACACGDAQGAGIAECPACHVRKPVACEAAVESTCYGFRIVVRRCTCGGYPDTGTGAVLHRPHCDLLATPRPEGDR